MDGAVGAKREEGRGKRKEERGKSSVVSD